MSSEHITANVFSFLFRFLRTVTCKPEINEEASATGIHPLIDAVRGGPAHVEARLNALLAGSDAV